MRSDKSKISCLNIANCCYKTMPEQRLLQQWEVRAAGSVLHWAVLTCNWGREDLLYIICCFVICYVQLLAQGVAAEGRKSSHPHAHKNTGSRHSFEGMSHHLLVTFHFSIWFQLIGNPWSCAFNSPLKLFEYVEQEHTFRWRNFRFVSWASAAGSHYELRGSQFEPLYVQFLL